MDNMMNLPQQNQQTIRVDLTEADQRTCECGCKLFIPAVTVFKISALVSPTGQEMMAQKPVLVCMDCKSLLK